MQPRRLVARDEDLIPHPREAVYSVLRDFSAYPVWWPASLDIEVLGPLPVQEGTRILMANGPFVWWTAEVVGLEAPAVLAMRYCDGAWRGDAAWRLEADNGGTRIVYEIDLEPTPLWLRLVGAVYNLRREHSRQIRRVFTAVAERVAAVDGRPPALQG